jgi:hypothetical protein
MEGMLIITWLNRHLLHGFNSTLLACMGEGMFS